MQPARPEPFDDQAALAEWEARYPGAQLEIVRYGSAGHYPLDNSMQDFDMDMEKCAASYTILIAGKIDLTIAYRARQTNNLGKKCIALIRSPEVCVEHDYMRPKKCR